jgi:hypothetical protein
LNERQPECVTLRAGDIVHRFYSASYNPVYFDRSTLGRLNAPDAAYGVLYAANNTAGAFAETFLRRPGRTLIDSVFLQQKAYARLEVKSDLQLIKLAGPGLAVLGATAEVVHAGLPYDVPQIWSKALFGHPVAAHGIAYHARHDDEELCYAFYDRSDSLIIEAGTERDLDQDWFWQLASRYRVGLAP